MKRRSLTLVLCLLATLSLASVGFAAWVISAGDTEEVLGTIQVETVNDERVTITKVSQNINDFIFGYKTNDQVDDLQNRWLDKNDVAEEKLTLIYTFTVENKKIDANVTTTNTAIAGTFAAYKMVEDVETPVSLDEAVTKGYIKAVPEVVIAPTVTPNEFTATVTFEWGALFGNENPYIFYNLKGINETFTVNETTGLPDVNGVEMSYGDHAAEFMPLMDTFFAGLNFRVTITANQPA